MCCGCLFAVRCVRLGCMGRVDLYRLDQHPLLTSCTSVMKLVRRLFWLFFRLVVLLKLEPPRSCYCQLNRRPWPG